MQTIIYTDSNPSNLTAFKEQIAAQGYNVLVCNAVIEILVEIEASRVDMIVLDLGLQDVGSDSICKLLKNHSLNDKVGILLVSENKGYSTSSSKLPDGADGLLDKPFEVSDLLAKISVIIAKTVGDLRFVQLKKKPKKKLQKKSNSGHFVGRYELLDKLGSGGNSIVYRAIDRDKPDSEPVAFKMFNTGVYQEIDSSSIDAFFLREAYGMSKLNHPNVVKLLDFGKKDDGVYFIVMELIEGRSLETITKHEGPIKEKQLISIAYQVSSVLQYLEENNVIHRDIKPGNILLNAADHIKLTDFGASKQLNDNSLTKNNEQFMGTPQFVSPEQIIGETEVDIRCDIYSLGATLYFCGTNIMPFAGDNVIDVLQNNMNESPDLMCQVNQEISLEFSNIVAKMLEKDKENRCSPSELNNDLMWLL